MAFVFLADSSPDEQLDLDGSTEWEAPDGNRGAGGKRRLELLGVQRIDRGEVLDSSEVQVGLNDVPV